MKVIHKFRSEANDYSLDEGTVLQDRYRVVRQLGHGGMGAVYEAVDERLGITVALKETLSSEASMLKQFEREARLLASMHHPALPRVSDHFVEGERAFLVMQYIGGVDLAKIIAQQPGPFPRDQVIAWADQLLDALVYLHSRDRQVIHRDIKPHNLKLTSTGQIALLDFGLAKAHSADTSLTSSRAFFGYTKHYAPLEQIQDQRTDQRSDIYALGATLYHLLTGIKPDDALVRATAMINSEPDPLKPANHVHGAVGPEIAAILSKAMAQKSEDRFATAREFREALRRIGRRREVSDAVKDARENYSGNRPARRVTSVYDTPFITFPVTTPASRFGPGTVAAILIVITCIGTSLWYVSPHLFVVSNRLEAPGVVTSSISERSNTVSRKTDRVRGPEKAGEAPSKARDNETVRAPKSEALATRTLEPKKRPAVSPEPQRRVNVLLENRRRPSAPNIRLPKPEVAISSRQTSVKADRNHNWTSGAPRFFQEADGTLIVKFPNGLVRVVKPGERVGQ